MPGPPLDAGTLRPYISSLILEYTGTMLDKALKVLRAQIEKAIDRHHGNISIVADELEGALTVDPGLDRRQTRQRFRSDR